MVFVFFGLDHLQAGAAAHNWMSINQDTGSLLRTNDE